jgi:hypothetical protein
VTKRPLAGAARRSASPGAGLPARPQSWLPRHLVWAAVVLAYLIVFPYFAQVNNPNENVRVWATRALAHHGTFAIDPVLHEWGDVGDRAAAGGHRYSSKAPGTSLLGVPVHFVHDRLARALTGASPSLRATTWALRVFTVVLPMALFLLLFGRRVESESGSPVARDLLTLGVGLGTLLYPYGLTFVGHAQSAALLFTGFLALTPGTDYTTAHDPETGRAHARALPRARLAIAGLLVGLSVVFEYQTLLAAAVVGLYALVMGTLRGSPNPPALWLPRAKPALANAIWRVRRRLPALLWFALGALGPALLLMLYHQALFGSPFSFPYAHLDDEGYRLFHHAQGFMGLGRPRARVITSAFVTADYGLFVFSPFLALGLLAALAAVVRRRETAALPAHAVTLAVTAVMALFLSGMANWRGGWCAGGPRYIAAVVPFLAFSVALAWKPGFSGDSGLARAARTALGALVLVSVFLCGLSGALFPHFPVQFDNPVFDLLVPLVSEGYVSYGLGTLAGLAGWAALGPWLLAVAVAVGAALAGMRPRWTAAAALLVAALLLVGLSQLGAGRNQREEARTRDTVRGMWEPPLPGGGR